MNSRRTTHRPATVAALLLAMFVAAMEMTVVSTAMPTVVAELGGALHYAWVFTAYMLTSTVTVPIYGKLADLYGRKPVLMVALAFFLLGSMASGQARTMTQLIVFRSVQGIGAGGIQPIAITVVGDIFTLEERAKMQGIFGATWAIAGLAGPLLGGLVVATLSWRWVFYINVPFGLLAAGVLSVSLVETVAKHDHKLDFAGALVLTGAVIALLLGTDGTMPWLLLPASAAGVALFLFVESRAEEPMLPLGLFKRRVIGTASVLYALSGGAMMGLVTFVPLYAQGVLGASPTQAGSTIATMAVTWPIASAIAGRLIVKVGFRPLVRVGFALVVSGALLLAYAMTHNASAGLFRVVAATYGVGMGIGNIPLVLAVQSTVDFSQRGVATSSTMFFRNMGGTIAVGVMGVVLAQSLVAGGGGAATSDLIAKMLGPERRSIDPAALQAIAGDLTVGLGRVAWVILGLAITAMSVAMLFPHVPTTKGPPKTPPGTPPPDEAAADV